MTTWGRFDPHFDSLDDFMSTELATRYLTMPQLFCWIQDWTHLQCDWILSKVPLLPFLKVASSNYHVRTSCFRNVRLQWSTIGLMRSTFWNKQMKERRNFAFLIRESQEKEIVKHFCPRERAQVLSLSCFITGGSEEWKGEEGKNGSVI